MKKYIVKQSEAIQEFKRLSALQEDAIICGLVEKTCVFPGQGEINKSYCTKNKIEIIDLQNKGGVIVASPGDVEIAIMLKNPNKLILQKYLIKLVHFLRDKGLQARFVGNDILVDGYKVCGFGFNPDMNGMGFYTIHIAVNVDLEKINKICKKPMNKIPKGLADYGITTEEIKELFMN